MRKQWVCQMVVIAVMLGWNVSAFAAHPLSTDDSGIVGQGENEMEIEYACAGCMDACCAYKHGINGTMDIGLSVPYRIEPVQVENVGALGLSMKFQLVEGLLAFSAAHEVGAQGYVLCLACSYQAGAVVLHANTGYNATVDNSNPGNCFFSIAGEYPLGKVDLVGEVFDEGSGSQGVLAGIRYWPGETYFVSAAGSGILGSQDIDTKIGLSVEF